jgi:hypothetical protein
MGSGVLDITSIGAGANLVKILFRGPNSSTTTQVGNVSLSTKGFYTLYYNLVDAAGNEGTAETTVEVKDMVTPQFTENTGEVVIEKGSSQGVVGSAITIPTVSGGTLLSDTTLYDSEGAVITSGTIDTTYVTSYTIKYTAVTGFGNTTTLERTISIKDRIPPNITVTPTSVQLDIGDKLNRVYGAKIDGYDWVTWNNRPNHTATYDDTGLNLSQAGTYQIKYTAKDDSNNERTTYRKVTVSTPSTIDDGDVYQSEPGQSGAAPLPVGGNQSTPRVYAGESYSPTFSY